jgi:hypothetical protein
MFRFTRSVTLKDTGRTPMAIENSMKIVSHLKENYDLELHHGVELFGNAKLHWWFDTKSLDDITEINSKLMTDKKYLGIVREVSEHYIEGSLHDTIIKTL